MNVLIYPGENEKLLTISNYQRAFKYRHIKDNLDIVASLLERFPLFSDLDMEIRREIAFCCELKYYEPEERILLKQGKVEDKGYLVLSGLCERGRHERSEVIDYIGAGDGVGIQSLLTEEPQLYELVTRTPCHLIRIDKQAFQNAARNHYELVVNLLKFTQRVYFREVQLHDRSRRLTKEARILILFRDIVDNTRNRVLADGHESLNTTYPFKTWMTQASLARQIGVSKSGVSPFLEIIRQSDHKYGGFALITGGSGVFDPISLEESCLNLPKILDDLHTKKQKGARKPKISS